MSAQNKAIMRQFFDEVFNKGNLAVIDKIVAENSIDHSAPPGVPPGREGLKAIVGMFRTAFPDLKVTSEDMIAEGDKVVARYTITGTHKGEFMGIKATGKKIKVTGMDIVRFTNGKAVEHWGNNDDMGMMQQLGVIPTPGAK